MAEAARIVVIMLAFGVGGSGAAAAALPTGVGQEGARHAFVIGAPGRLDAATDRRLPRRYAGDGSAVAAYVDVEQVADPTWLAHEIERYARAYDCGVIAAAWCRREVRGFGGGGAIYVAVGERAELVWRSGEDRAVRLTWRRVVETPTGTMTLDTPPAEFGRMIAVEMPSRLVEFDFDAVRARDFAENEIDRLVYYIDRALGALSAEAPAAQPRRAEWFVAANLRRIERLRSDGRYRPAENAVQAGEQPGTEVDADVALNVRLAEELAALRQWRATAAARLTPAETLPWCAARLPVAPTPGAVDVSLPRRDSRGAAPPDQKGMSSSASGGPPPASSPGGALKP